MKIKYVGPYPQVTLETTPALVCEHGKAVEVDDDIGKGLVETQGENWQKAGSDKTKSTKDEDS